jgi:CBS domain-containing protein
MLHDRISQIMTHMGVTTTESASAREAAKVMAERNIGALIVADAGRVSGIVTERDILWKAGSGASLGEVAVSDIMTRQVITIPSDTRILEAADMMVKHSLRCIPVVDGGLLVGVVTATDLVFEMNTPLAKGRISEYMNRTVHTVEHSALVADALRVMMSESTGCVVVMRGGDVSGMLTERVILREVLSKGKSIRDTLVEDIMPKEVVKLDWDTQVTHACHLMYYYGIRRFPVVNKKGTVIGVISERDILRALRPIYET